MTERGLPIVDGAPACPFVAFADDRDERATSPDHRHRCYAEAEPAPRALAHQEAYCLSSAFPVCPTFQDWARREAARARPKEPTLDGSPDESEFPPLVSDEPRRRSGRAWSAPPPWLRGQSGPAGQPDRAGPLSQPPSDRPVADRSPGAPGPVAGLAGSFADRLASHPDEPAAFAEQDLEEPEPWVDPRGDAPPTDTDVRLAPPAHRREHERIDASREQEARERDVYAPAWERPRRLEAYPTLRSRRLPSLALPPVLLALAAVVLAALALFFLPSWLGIGGSPAASPTPSVAASPSEGASAEPTLAPAESPQTYTVKSGDTLGGIARKYGVTLQALQAANGITNPDKIAIGQVLVIPSAIPSELPGASTSP